jgi:diguanylate cyclase (GGDEF)-like protein/PAS domain S-box-containing protein
MNTSADTPASPAHSGKGWLRPEQWLPWLVLAISLLITWQLWRDAKQNAVQELQSNFDFRVYETDSLVKQRMMAYEQVLRGVVGLFASSKSVERSEFRDFVSTLHLEKIFPGIQGVSFALVVPAAGKAKHIAAVRKEGFPEYTIKPEGEREIYTPVMYIEPFTGLNLRVPGFDNYSNPERRIVMDMARDSGDAVITGKIKLMQETNKNIQAGCLMFMPVYKNGVPHDTLAERRANIIGWVASAFRMDDLMHGILGKRSADLDIEIYDGAEMSDRTLMYDDDKNMSGGAKPDSRFQSINRVEIAGHPWTMMVDSLPSFEAQLDMGKSRFIGYAGICTGILLALLTWLLMRGRTQALQLVVRAQESRAMIENSPDTVARYDCDCCRIYVNPALGAMDEDGVAALLGKKPSEYPGGQNFENYETKIKEVIATGENTQFELKWLSKDGREFYNHIRLTAERDSSGRVTSVLGVGRDITELNDSRADLKRANVQLENMNVLLQSLATSDPLTHLPNRRLLLDRLKQALASSARSGREGALLFIDLDNFKTLNDTLGHDIGDILLQQVARRLESCIREGDTVARLGGDEFVVMLEGLSEKDLEAAAQTEAVGEQILASLNRPYMLDTHECHNSPSIGATLFSDHQQSIEELLKQADIAMYQAKKDGRNTLRFFDPQMQENINARAALESELHKALENQQFHLYYQIQVNGIQTDGSCRTIGAEALIRWIHPERGLVAPVQFIPMAEESGLILLIGHWVLETACAQLKAWQQETLTRDIVLAVNVSAKQFRQAAFVVQVQDAIQRHAINPMLLKLELTESLLLEDIEDTIATMEALKEIGVQFSLDDFGTGYSSLQYLKRLPLDQLKIDRSFVRDLASDGSDRAIVRTIIAMAHSLNLNVIAEGVETEEQLQLLLNKGCIHYQGYLFSKPVPIEQFEALLKQG